LEQCSSTHTHTQPRAYSNTAPSHFRAKREQLKGLKKFPQQRQGQNLVLTVLNVSNTLDCGQGRKLSAKDSHVFFFFITMQPRVE